MNKLNELIKCFICNKEYESFGFRCNIIKDPYSDRIELICVDCDEILLDKYNSSIKELIDKNKVQ